MTMQAQQHDAAAALAALRDQHAEALTEKDEQIAYLAERVAALPPIIEEPKVTAEKAGPTTAEVVALAKAKIDASYARIDAIATRLEKQAGTAPAPGATVLDEAMGRVRQAEAQQEAAARAAPPPPAFWREALRQLGESLAPDMPPSHQRNEALRSPEGRRLMAAATADARMLDVGG